MHWKQWQKHKKNRHTLEANEMKVPRKIIGKTKIDRIRILLNIVSCTDCKIAVRIN